MSPAVDREGSKWDRAARLLRVATVLHAHRKTAKRIAADREAYEAVRRLTEALGRS